MFKKVFKLSHIHSSYLASRRFYSQRATPIKDEILDTKTDYSNISDRIIDLVDRKLYTDSNHPLGIIWDKLKEFFSDPEKYRGPLQARFKTQFTCLEGFSPIVTTKSCFDDLLTPKDHVSRKRSETYYVSRDKLLRSHTTAHEPQLLNENQEAWVLIGDVYRRDAIDATHYPCFHQVKLYFLLRTYLSRWKLSEFLTLRK